MSSWRDLLDHEGVVVIDLRLRHVANGGPKREIASGYVADWIWGPGSVEAGPDAPALPLRAPLDIADGARRCIHPGDRATVHAHPFQPELWAPLPLGTTVQLCRLSRTGAQPYTVIGEGTITAMIDVPDQPTPLRYPDRPQRPGGATLRRGSP